MKRFLILILIITSSVSFGQTPSYVPTNGLVGWWPFNGNANDESGNGNNGTVNGAVITSDRLGSVNSAYNFDGVNDKIVITHNSSFNFTEFSISCWVLKDNQSLCLVDSEVLRNRHLRVAAKHCNAL